MFGTIKSSAQLVLLSVNLYWTIASLDLLQSSRIFSGCKWEALKRRDCLRKSVMKSEHLRKVDIVRKVVVLQLNRKTDLVN